MLYNFSQISFSYIFNDIDFNKLTAILSIILILILCFLSLSLYKNNNLRAKANDLLQDKNGELQKAKEKAELDAKLAKKQLKKYTFIRIDKHLKLAITQYLSFF
tara:strand:+ start:199 stop:510 length:312 start_codon:yes stop_codon:yes gene_type:complete